MPWSQRFFDPIPLSDGRTLLSLGDAGDYLVRLRKTKRDLPHWQTAAELLILVGNHGGDPMLARIAMTQALNFGKAKPTPAPRIKRAKAYRIVR